MLTRIMYRGTFQVDQLHGLRVSSLLALLARATCDSPSTQRRSVAAPAVAHLPDATGKPPRPHEPPRRYVAPVAATPAAAAAAAALGVRGLSPEVEGEVLVLDHVSDLPPHGDAHQHKLGEERGENKRGGGGGGEPEGEHAVIEICRRMVKTTNTKRQGENKRWRGG